MKLTRSTFKLFVAMLVGVFALPVAADDESKTRPLNRILKTNVPIQGVEVVDLFEAIKKDQIEVQLIAPNVEKANIIVKNKMNKPLGIKMPAAFAGVPVLPQGIGAGIGGGQGGGFGGGQGGGLGGGQGGQNQGVGGGFGGGQQGGGFGGGQRGGQRGGGNNLFNIPAGKVGRVKVNIVCMEHGKKDPHARVKYEIRPIENHAQSAASAEVLKMLSAGQIHRDVAQACSWHLENGLSWEELASKDKIVSSFGGYSEKYFTIQQIRFAQQVCAVAKSQAAALKKQQSKKQPSQSDYLKGTSQENPEK